MKAETKRAQTPCLVVEPARAQSVLDLLRAKGWVDVNYEVGKANGRILIPIREDSAELVENAHLGEMEMAVRSPLLQRPGSLQKELSAILTSEQMGELGSSFDIIGDIAQLELSDELGAKQDAIAAAIMRLYPHVKTVVKKAESTGGAYRIRPVTVIAGEKRTRTISKENGCSLVVDLNEAYYNPRVASERMRIVEQIGRRPAGGPGENVLVLFAGVGPYAILAEKKAIAMPAKIVAIELNPKAVEMMEENIKLNHCKRIEAVCADVEKELAKPRYLEWADRIIMPHPSDSMRFLPIVLKAAKKGAIIHLYAFGQAEDPLSERLAEAQEIGQKLGLTLSLHAWRVVRTYSPNLVQIVMDLWVGL